MLPIAQARAPSGRIFDIHSICELLGLVRLAMSTSSPTWTFFDLPGADGADSSIPRQMAADRRLALGLRRRPPKPGLRRRPGGKAESFPCSEFHPSIAARHSASPPPPAPVPAKPKPAPAPAKPRKKPPSARVFKQHDPADLEREARESREWWAKYGGVPGGSSGRR
jgi:hypothetical protein